ncbi:hypothetical protein HPP92_015954 [Vanilla planifolia]|uniref:Uncharacterized protein n=1 Tax=Vanilla planifolia TaxID=51239 RepID=A0A835QMP6_VANPL|nr:hypothetical protein HPP92_015954 [Vanilla planifolia]
MRPPNVSERGYKLTLRRFCRVDQAGPKISLPLLPSPLCCCLAECQFPILSLLHIKKAFVIESNGLSSCLYGPYPLELIAVGGCRGLL